MALKHSSALPPEILRVFETLPQPYLILSKELFILTASNAYLQLTGKNRAQICERYIFDVFPKIPDWSSEEGGISLSLNQVIETLKPHQLPVMRFDIPDTSNLTKLSERYWHTAHTPVLDAEGEISYIIHHTQDVTEQVIAERNLKISLLKETETAKRAEQLNIQMEKLFNEIPAQIAIVSGPDLVYEFVNPQYKKELFPNRDVLGKPVLEALPEVQGQPIWDALQHVYKTGETFAINEIRISLADVTGGPLRDHYFNYVYQAIRDEKGGITSVLSFKYEITELVLAKKQLEKAEKELLTLNYGLAQANEEIQAANEEIQATNEEIQSANEELTATNEELLQAQQNLIKLNDELEERVDIRTLELFNAQAEAAKRGDRLRRFFMQAPAGICVLDGPDLVFELVNPTYQQLFPGRDLVGKPLLEALPELKGQLIEDVLNNVYTTGNSFEGKELMVPLARTPNGPVEDRYFNFIYQARHDATENVDGIMVFVFEVTETVHVRQKEKENEQRFRFMLNAIPQQVWTALPSGKLDYVNEIVCDDFGMDMKHIIDRGWHVFIHPEDIHQCLQKWKASLQTGKEYMAEFRLKFLDGEYRWHLARALPLVENGQIKMWIGTNTDIEIQKNNEHKKDEFLSIASHELKTPLTSIKAFNQLMLRVDDPKKLAGFIQKSATHVLRLEKLISDLLDVTRINAGKITYNMEPFNFMEMLTDSVESVQHTTSSHKIILENVEDVEYTGDRFRLEQVVNNLLSNAIKYSPNADKVFVNCIVYNDSLVVSVQDFGIGIEEKDLTRLFDRYYRVDNTAMRFEGLGLGLFISAEILKRHNGSFWIESTPGEGSTFYFRLMLDPWAGHSESLILDNHFFHDSCITISYNKEHKRLDADWTGFQNLESVQRGCTRMLDMLEKNGVSKVLNNNTNVLGNWSEASDWGATEWFPAMEKAGLRYFAWVYSPSVFSNLAAHKSVDNLNGQIVTRFFSDTTSAEEWVNAQE